MEEIRTYLATRQNSAIKGAQHCLLNFTDERIIFSKVSKTIPGAIVGGLLGGPVGVMIVGGMGAMSSLKKVNMASRLQIDDIFDVDKKAISIFYGSIKQITYKKYLNAFRMIVETHEKTYKFMPSDVFQGLGKEKRESFKKRKQILEELCVILPENLRPGKEAKSWD